MIVSRLCRYSRVAYNSARAQIADVHFVAHNLLANEEAISKGSMGANMDLRELTPGCSSNAAAKTR